MKKALLSFILCYSLFHSVRSQDTITYKIAFPNAVHHEAEILLNIKNVDVKEITAVMSKSSPGRYSIHNFGKNIYNLKAFENGDEEIPVKRVEPDCWSITGFESEVNISYSLYANYANGTYSGIDANFANLNMPSSLLWIKKLENCNSIEHNR